MAPPLFQQPEAAAQRTSLAVGKVLERTGCSRRASRPNRKFVLNFLAFPVEGLRIALLVVLQLDGLAVRRTLIGFGPCVLTCL